MDADTLVRTAQEAGVQPLEHEPLNSDKMIDSLKYGSMGMIMSSLQREFRKLERERKKQLHDENIRCNHKFCRKKCKLFKERQCYRKTFQQQTECVDSRGYEKEEVALTPEVVQ